jgi:SAM-dependent methyltransferase
MKTHLIDLLICPACLPAEEELRCQFTQEQGEDVVTGALRCGRCGAKYPIREGIAHLLPRPKIGSAARPSKYEGADRLSSYLWSHFADLFSDRDASQAYAEWAGMVPGVHGFALDTGCAVGRFTFELSRKSDFVVGIDNSESFIRAARRLMLRRETRISLPEEGRLQKTRQLGLPDTWDCGKVEFLVGDVQALPFRSGSFSLVASLNILDKVPVPMLHLEELNRVASLKNAHLLFSDPFSWSSEVAKEENWLGGLSDGPYAGSGLENVMSLLTAQKGELSPPWRVHAHGDVWWKIRNHRNHFELIRSCFIKADR